MHTECMLWRHHHRIKLEVCCVQNSERRTKYKLSRAMNSICMQNKRREHLSWNKEAYYHIQEIKDFVARNSRDIVSENLDLLTSFKTPKKKDINHEWGINRIKTGSPALSPIPSPLSPFLFQFWGKKNKEPSLNPTSTSLSVILGKERLPYLLTEYYVRKQEIKANCHIISTKANSIMQKTVKYATVLSDKLL